MRRGWKSGRNLVCFRMKTPFLKAALCAGLLLSVVAPAAPLRAEGKNAWQEDVPKALAQAKAEKKLVLVDLTGSDWCSACLILEKELFSNPRFQQYAQEHLILVRLDFPQEKPQDPVLRHHNQEFAMKYNPEGIIPLYMVLNADGKVLTLDEGYKPGTANEIINNLVKLKG